MRRMESDCLGCALPCIGRSCPYHGKRLHLYCDECGNEDEKLYESGRRELCVKCFAMEKAKDFLADYWEELEDDFKEWAEPNEVYIPDE